MFEIMLICLGQITFEVGIIEGLNLLLLIAPSGGIFDFLFYRQLGRELSPGIF